MPIFQKENEGALRVETTESKVVEIADLKEQKRVLLINTQMENERHANFMGKINTRMAEVDTLLSEAEKVGIDVVAIKPAGDEKADVK